MTGITMFDSVDLSQIPADAQAIGAYVDGRFANSTEAGRRFPHAHVLTIAVTAAHDADCLDIEQGDATPGQAVGWFARQKARGITRPCLYASAFVMDTEVWPAIRAAGIGRRNVRLWSAHYTGTAHICGPLTCRELGTDATQWTDRALQRNLDESLVADDFFGTVTPPDWQEAMMSKLPTLQQGAADKAGQVFYVHRLQALLACYGRINSLTAAACLRETGTFGATTTVAVKAVQASKKLTADGIVGPATWGVLVTGSAP